MVNESAAGISGFVPDVLFPPVLYKILVLKTLEHEAGGAEVSAGD